MWRCVGKYRGIHCRTIHIKVEKWEKSLVKTCNIIHSAFSGNTPSHTAPSSSLTPGYLLDEDLVSHLSGLFHYFSCRSGSAVPNKCLSSIFSHNFSNAITGYPKPPTPPCRAVSDSTNPSCFLEPCDLSWKHKHGPFFTNFSAPAAHVSSSRCGISLSKSLFQQFPSISNMKSDGHKRCSKGSMAGSVDWPSQAWSSLITSFVLWGGGVP